MRTDSGTVRLEPARESMLDELAAAERVCFPSDPWESGVIRSMLDGYLLARDAEGTLAGWLVYRSVLDEGSIENVAVLPAFRRQGIAARLLEETERRAREGGMAVLYLEVRASNEAALRLYESHGFESVGRRKNYYTAPREDAILMTKTL